MARRLRVWTVGALMVLCVAGVSLATVPRQQSVTPVEPAASARAAINQYCLSCHSTTVKTAGLALDAGNLDKAGENPAVWEKVGRKLRGRMMPPPGRPRPDESTCNSVVAYLEKSLDAAAAANPNPGRTETFRRLNRSEYQNAIRDLLALDVDVTSMLPKDRRLADFYSLRGSVS